MNLLRAIMKRASREGARLFRQNTGEAWQGDAERLPNGNLLLKNPRRVRMGLVTGSSDLIGWRSITVTPDMVGRAVAVFSAIEGKSLRGRVRPEQENFIRVVLEAGGLAGVARSEADATTILDGG